MSVFANCPECGVRMEFPNEPKIGKCFSCGTEIQHFGDGRMEVSKPPDDTTEHITEDDNS
jgi:hypothetical protein